MKLCMHVAVDQLEKYLVRRLWDQLLWFSVSRPREEGRREKKKKNERGEREGRGGEEEREKRGATGEATTPIKVFSHYAWPRRK